MDPSTIYPPEYLAAYRGERMVHVGIVMGILETIMLVLYYTSKFRNKTIRGMDSYLTLPAYLFCFSNVILCFLLLKYADNGYHVAAVPYNKIIIWLKMELAVQFLYIPAVTLPKMCIVFLYLRIFTTKPYRYAAHTINFVLVLNLIICEILTLTACTPFAFNWNKLIPHGHCINLKALYMWVSVPNLLTDVCILVLPLPVIWKLQTSRTQKVGLTITFLTASVGILTAILRFKAFATINVFADITWNSIEMMTWCVVEPGVYFIAACLPSLRPLFKPLWKHCNFGSLRSLRSIFQSKFISHSRPTEDKSAKSVPLSSLERLNGPGSHSIRDGNDQKALVACYRESDAEFTDTTNYITQSSAIRVKKEYTFSREEVK